MAEPTLLESVKSRDLEAITRTLDAGTPPDLGDHDNITALSWAAGLGFADVVKLLLERGANPELPDRYMVLPIQRAANAGHVEAVRLLVEHGARYHVPQANILAMAGAAYNGQLEVVRYFIEEKSVPINDRSPMGGTALHSAAANGHLAVVEYLLRNGADPRATNNHGMTVITWVESTLKLSGLEREVIQTLQKILGLLKAA